MLAVMDFWLARGADGFRIDALRQCIKDDRWRDNPANPDWREGGGTPTRPPCPTARGRTGCSATTTARGWSAGSGRRRRARRRPAAAARASSPTLYYGDELGMRDVDVAPDRVQDPWELRVPVAGSAAIRSARRCSGTPAGTPASPPEAATPWLPLAPDAREVTVEAQREDPASMLGLYRALLALRRAAPALHAGEHRTVGADGAVLVYERSAEPDRLLIALNLGGGDAEAALSGATGEVALGTRSPGRGAGGRAGAPGRRGGSGGAAELAPGAAPYAGSRPRAALVAFRTPSGPAA